MKCVVVIGVFQRSWMNGKGKYVYEFHFQGAYTGVYIKKVCFCASSWIDLKRQGSYIVYLTHVKIIEETLWGKLEKIKDVYEIS